jgi:hypothetical protein
MGAAVDQKHRRLAGSTAGRLDHVEVGNGCVGEAAGPADSAVVILRGDGRRCK